jgi:hypothetical protein
VHEAWCAEAEAVTPQTALPIRSLVGTQLGSVLAAARWLNAQS